MNFTQEQLDTKYKTLPQDLKEAIDSVEIGNLIAEIGNNNGLLLDKTAELMDQTALVMLGIITSKEFEKNLVKKLQIDDRIATSIASEINDKVFGKIRSSLQKIQSETPEQTESEITPPPQNPQPQTIPTPPTPPISHASLEQAGQFTIENHTAPASDEHKIEINKEDVLKHIEDHVPMVDHLLTTHVSAPEQMEVKKVEVVKTATPTPPAPPVEKKSYTLDPYREQI